jgi:hypothetical protein
MSKYTNRNFVMLPHEASTIAFSELQENVQAEIKQTSAYFACRKFTRNEFIEVTAGLIRARAGFGSKGGKDYSRIEASRRFAEAIKPKFSLVFELK